MSLDTTEFDFRRMRDCEDICQRLHQAARSTRWMVEHSRDRIRESREVLRRIGSGGFFLPLPVPDRLPRQP